MKAPPRARAHGARPLGSTSAGGGLGQAQPGRRLEALTWQAADGLHIDVRGLEPPQPLVSIMRLVLASAPDGVVIVHHDRDPKLLYPELLNVGWWAERIEGEPGEVRLKLARADDADGGGDDGRTA